MGDMMHPSPWNLAWKNPQPVSIIFEVTSPHTWHDSLKQVTFDVEEYAIDSLMLADKLQIWHGLESWAGSFCMHHIFIQSGHIWHAEVNLWCGHARLYLYCYILLPLWVKVFDISQHLTQFHKWTSSADPHNLTLETRILKKLYMTPKLWWILYNSVVKSPNLVAMATLPWQFL